MKEGLSLDVIENILLAVAGLKANKMRTVLTMLGIIIGIGAVIAIVTMGNSMSKSVAASMSKIGTNKIEVYVMQKAESAEYKEPDESDCITENMIEQYKNAYPDQVEDVAVSENVGTGKSEDGNKYANVNVTGVNQSFASVEKIEMMYGRFIIRQDVERGKNVAVVSDRFVANMFSGRSPIGQEISVNINGKDKLFTIVGVYQFDMTNMGTEKISTSEKDLTTQLYIPSTSAKMISNTKKGYLNFSVITSAGTDQTAFTQETKQYFNQFYKNNKYFQVESYSMKAMVQEMDSMTKTLTLAISAIAGISLLVGGIGVMNIMLVSITERTKEIGTRKALGAPNSAIRFQFIVESIIICLIGGIIGIAAGVGLGSIGAQLMGYPAAPSPAIVLIAVSFSMAIGVSFGYYPANKAAKMNPIDALRYE